MNDATAIDRAKAAELLYPGLVLRESPWLANSVQVGRVATALAAARADERQWWVSAAAWDADDHGTYADLATRVAAVLADARAHAAAEREAKVIADLRGLLDWSESALEVLDGYKAAS